MSAHPSDYALDRAALGAAPPDVAAHLARCPACAAAVASRRVPADPPAWLASVKIGPERPRRRRWWFLPIPLLAAAAGMVVAFHGATIRSGADAIREKGAPRVEVFVKRGDAVVAWDGRAPVRPGDRLQLSIRGGGYAHASIASLTASPDAPAVLWAGPLQRDRDTVPPASFRVDAQGSREIVSVLLSTQPITPWQHVGAPRHDESVWSIRLEILKEAAR